MAPECLTGWPQNQCIPCSWLWELSQDTPKLGLASVSLHKQGETWPTGQPVSGAL